MIWETKWLLRHESPISEDGRFFSQLCVDLGHDHSYGKHTIIDAAYNGDEGLVKSLMSDQSEVSYRNEKGWTALNAVSIAGHLAIARILLREPLRFNTNAHDNVGRTPLMLAAETGHDDIIDLLIDSGADPNYEHPESLMAVLNQAIKYERPSTLQILLLKGADSNKPNSMGLTPLLFACQYPDMARILLSNGADPFVKSSHGMTALHSAARAGAVKMINQLLDRGMHPNMLETQFSSRPFVQRDRRARRRCGGLAPSSWGRPKRNVRG